MLKVENSMIPYDKTAKNYITSLGSNLNPEDNEKENMYLYG